MRTNSYKLRVVLSWHACLIGGSRSHECDTSSPLERRRRRDLTCPAFFILPSRLEAVDHQLLFGLVGYASERGGHTVRKSDQKSKC